MTEEQRELLLLASRMISYPDSTEDEWLFEASGEVKNRELHVILSNLLQIPLHERQKLYVATFDLKKRNGLYLSSHEFGDSPKRGAALIRIQKIISEAGFERIDRELADFIPMLLELTAIADPSPAIERLIERLGAVIHEIELNIEEGNIYGSIFTLLMTEVFETPSEAQIEQMKRDREEADLEELPYPLLYK